MISVVIRARDEAAWLGRCLRALSGQSLKIDDVILVDNESSDNTREIAYEFGAKVLNISKREFSFGRALNLGIRHARNEVVAIISAHCIPVNELWAQYISVHLKQQQDIATCGVYGRQIPLPETSDIDARDLWTTFRTERQIQRQDFFFHNANSAIRKSIWSEIPFDESLNGVEDRAWAKVAIKKGFQVVYEPHACVYHHHGIHQGRNEARARRVAQSIRYIQDIL